MLKFIYLPAVLLIKWTIVHSLQHKSSLYTTKDGRTLTDEDVACFTEEKVLDFNDGKGPDYIDGGLNGTKALRITYLDEQMEISSSRRIRENSISFWFRPTGFEHADGETDADNYALMTGPGFSLQTNDENQIGLARQVTIFDKLNYDNYFEPVSEFFSIGELREWHHIGLTFNENQTFLFFNGEEIANFENKYLINFKTDENIILGPQFLTNEAGESIKYRSSAGAIDTVRIFQGMLTHRQMWNLYIGETSEHYTPEAVSRSLPSTGMNNIPFEKVTLQWFPHSLINKVTPNREYKIQISEDVNFQNVVFEELVAEPLCNVLNLDPSTHYFWKIMIVDEEQDSPSPIWSFVTRGKDPVNDILTVMEFNVLGVSDHGTDIARKHGAEYAAEIIRNNSAELVSLLEGGLMCKTVANILSYNYIVDPDEHSRFSPCLLSKFPIVGESYPPYGKKNEHVSAHILLPDGEVIEFTILHPVPKDSGQDLTMMDITNQEAIDRECKARCHAITDILEILNNQTEISNIIIAGDFNSVSVLDFNEETSQIHNDRGEVEWPVTSILRDNGFIDSFRTVHPDPMKDIGDTWSDRYRSVPQGRIDHIYSRGDKFVPISSEVIYTHPSIWISDHNAVVTTYKISADELSL